MPIMETSLYQLVAALQDVTAELPPEESDRLIVATIRMMVEEGRIRSVGTVSNN